MNHFLNKPQVNVSNNEIEEIGSTVSKQKTAKKVQTDQPTTSKNTSNFEIQSSNSKKRKYDLESGVQTRSSKKTKL